MQTQTKHPAGGRLSGQTSTKTLRIGRYEIDPDHSSVRLRTRHLFGLAPVRGRFAIRSGTVAVAEPLTGSSVSAEIDVASFHTSNPMRNAAVRSSRFLDAANHPFMSFSSERIEGSRIAGTLTVHGVTKPVSLAVEDVTVSADWFTTRAATRVDRTEFGITASRGLASRYLDLTIEVRCVRA